MGSIRAGVVDTVVVVATAVVVGAIVVAIAVMVGTSVVDVDDVEDVVDVVAVVSTATDVVAERDPHAARPTTDTATNSIPTRRRLTPSVNP